MHPFETYLRRWLLTPDGDPFTTPSSHLLAVRRRDGNPAMLKVPLVDEERVGGALMVWWDGDGAASVFARDEDTGALLIERAMGPRSLAVMARDGRDDDANRIMCSVADRLHAPRARALPALAPLAHWFRQLEPGAARYGGIIATAHAVARDLLSTPQDLCALHGDLHHGNVLDFGDLGFLAIDPKGLLGERAFDFANLFFNPEDEAAIVLAPGRVARTAAVIAEAARVDRMRLLQWVLAYGGLSAVWRLDDGLNVLHDVAVAEIAAAELNLAA